MCSNGDPYSTFDVEGNVSIREDMKPALKRYKDINVFT